MLLEIPLTFVLSFLHDIFAACYLVWKLPQDGYLAYGFLAIVSEILSIIETKYKRYKWVNLLARDLARGLKRMLDSSLSYILTVMNLDEQRYINLLELYQILLPQRKPTL